MQQVAARHQMAAGAGRGAEGEGFVFKISECFDLRIGGDKHAFELCVFGALHERNGCFAAAQVSLHKGKAAVPNHVDLFLGESFNCGGVIGDRNELYFQAGFGFEILAEWCEFSLQFSRVFVWNCGDF